MADPDVLEEINEPNLGFEKGLNEFSENDIGHFKAFFNWSLTR